MNRRGVRPGTMKKFMRAKALYEDKSQGINLDIACMRAGISKPWYLKILQRIKKGEETPEGK
jgi:hypothetical protein